MWDVEGTIALGMPSKLYARGAMTNRQRGRLWNVADCPEEALSRNRLTHHLLDYLILSSDSGRLSILEFEMHPTPHFASLYQETYGKTGARRMVPGQWLAADPKGRSVMVGS